MFILKLKITCPPKPWRKWNLSAKALAKVENLKFPLGFTLIEMLVTLSIISALSAMILVYSRRSETISNLIREGDHLVFELQRIQNQAMLTLQMNTNNEEKICGWGMYINPNLPQEQVLLFRDLCLTNEDKGNGKYDNGEEVETISLLRGTEISESNITSVVFIPPEPKIKFYPELSGNTNANIKIKLKSQDDSYYEIQISPAGQIYKQLQET